MKTTLSAIVCLAALLSAPAALAQSSDHAPDVVPAQSDGLKLSASIWAGAVAADHITTFQFRTRYPALLHEENPLVRPLENHPAWLVGVNGAIDAATGWAVYRFVGRAHPRIATLAFYGAAAYRTYLSAHNVHMMQQARTLNRTSP